MVTADKIEVYCNERKVGTIAPYQKYLTAFEYSPEWLETGFSVNPFSLPLGNGVKISKRDPFDGLFGIFADSLPDGWGRLLVDRMLRKEGEEPDRVSAFSRLSIVGASGMGALEYRPVYELKTETMITDMDRLSEECAKILRSEESDDLDTLFAMGGSSGGARPKVFLNIEGEDWIIKFPSSSDQKDAGFMEYKYNLCASKCGIDVPEARLFPSDTCRGYFGTKRFDRKKSDGKTDKIHMASASALLEVSHRVPSLDYTSLMALTWQLTKKSDEMRKLFMLMCFNIFAHNRDDHSNNFSYLYDNEEWKLAPAYDLTFSDSIGGEHATTIAGEGKDPSMDDIFSVAKKAGLAETEAKKMAGDIKEIVYYELSDFLSDKKK